MSISWLAIAAMLADVGVVWTNAESQGCDTITMVPISVPPSLGSSRAPVSVKVWRMLSYPSFSSLMV